MAEFGRSLMRITASIRTRVTLVAVAALALGIAATTALLVQRAELDTLASQRERELNEAMRIANVLTQRTVELEHALAATANVMTPALLVDDAGLRGFLDASPVLRGMFAGLYVADARGRMLAGIDGSRWIDTYFSVADRDYFRRTIAEQRPVVSEPVNSRSTGEPLVIITAPLRNGTATYGVLAGMLRLTARDLLDDLVDRSETGSDVLQIVTDATGRILAHPDRSRIMQSLDTEPRMAAGFAQWQAAGAPPEPSGLLFEQPGEVLAMAAAPGPDWLVWRALPEADLLAPLRVARQQSLVWAAAIVGTASLVVFGLIGWLLRPLAQLKQRSQHLFDDGHAIDAGWPQAGGEIGELVRVLRHVGAERAQLERFNAQVLARLGSVMEAAPVGILFTRGLHFELVSAELCRIFGRQESDFLGQHAAIMFTDPDDAERLQDEMRQAFDARSPYVGEWKMRKADGRLFWAVLHAQAADHDDPSAGAIWTLSDVSVARAARQELEWSAGHDALTGLANRALFERRIDEIFTAQPGSRPAALVMIDLDRFKPINDTAGHAAGDAMLKAVAEAIAGHTRGSDLAARLGGDEFAVLLEHCPPQAAQRVAETLRRAIGATTVAWQGRSLTVGASLGVASLDEQTPTVAAWIEQADRACYDAKAAGRDTVRLATPAPAAAAVAATPAATAVDAIDTDEFFVIG